MESEKERKREKDIKKEYEIKKEWGQRGWASSNNIRQSDFALE